MNMKINEDVPVIYCAPALGGFAQDPSDPLVFEKEMIYEGNFAKGDHRFIVTKEDLQHWKLTHGGMLATGIKIPVPVEHTTDPEKNRGEVIGVDVRTRPDGKLAAYGRVKFNDAAAAAQHKNSDVSIYVEPSFKDGNGTVWRRPIRHLALTNYPVIPGLGTFQPIAASFEGGLDMSPMVPLAQQLGIQNADQKDDAALTAEIVASFSSLVDKVKKLEGAGQQPPQVPGQPPGMPGAPPVAGPPKMQLSAPLLSMFRDNRQNKIDNLVRNGNITKATRDKLIEEYCNDEALALAFDSVEATASDVKLDGLVMALSLNSIPVAQGERSGAQAGVMAMSLSNPTKNGVENPLVANAEARAKEFAG